MSNSTWNILLWEATEESVLTLRSQTVDLEAADALISWAGTLPQGRCRWGIFAMS